MNLPNAEDMPYWKTSQSGAERWMERCAEQITRAGGHTAVRAVGQDRETGWAALLLRFSLDGQAFKMVWPVLEARSGNERAARVQAATMLYHDVKARCLSAQVLGARTAFFAFLELPDGRTAQQVGDEDVAEAARAMFGGEPERALLRSGEGS